MNIYNMDLKELQGYFLSIGEKPFRALQVFEWLYRHKVKSFDEMTNIKKEILEKLKKSFYIKHLNLEEQVQSSDGTIKFLFSLEDGLLIETVLMKQEYGNSLCVTSQVGCLMGCSFCASGLKSKERNLLTAEMVNQIMSVEEIIKERISHVVVMGIGEPFDNYENLTKFLNIINVPKGLEIGARHISVSTSGIIPKILEFAHFGLQTNLAISLHAPTEELRSKLMKINRKYPLKELIKAIKEYIEITNRRVTIEYILLKDVNDSNIDAYNLSQLLYGLNVYVNLIPYNEVIDLPYKRPTNEVMTRFYDILKKQNIQVTLRKEQGHDINAACGQLRAKYIVK